MINYRKTADDMLLAKNGENVRDLESMSFLISKDAVVPGVLESVENGLQSKINDAIIQKVINKIYFSSINNDFSIWGFSKEFPEYRIVIENSELDELTLKKKKTNIINNFYNVIFINVDHIQKIIYASYKQAKDIMRPKVIKMLVDAIDNEGSVKVNAKIVGFKTKGKNIIIRLDIAGLGIPGMVPIYQWSHKYVNNTDEIQKGSICEVLVYGYEKYDDKEMPFFKCSRKALIPDPWVDIEKKFPVGAITVVECVEKFDNRFYGAIEGIEDLYVYCQYPAPSIGIPVNVGEKYNVKVYKVDQEKVFLNARVISSVRK